jgi:hypothetical protein
MDPAECEWILWTCYPPEPDPCTGEYERCLASGEDPAVCEEILLYCGGMP